MAANQGTPVAFLVSTLTTGGAERQLEHIVRHLEGGRIAPRLYALRAAGTIGERFAAAGIPVAADLAPRTLPTPWLPFALAARFRRDGIRAVYCLDHTNAVVAGVLAAKFAGGLPLLLAIHTMGERGKPSIPAPVRMSLAGITRIIAVAEAQRRYLVESEGIPPGKITVIRNGIPVLEPAGLPSQAEARAALGIAPDDGPVVGIVAMLRPEKGHEVFLAAAHEIAARHPRAVFLLVGEGPRRPELEELTRALDIDRRVRFLGRRDDVPHILRALDLSVLASHREALPLSLMESMSLEVPVVATRVGALDELVEDGVEGKLVPPGDPGALAAAMNELLADPERLREAGRAARRKILAQFTIQRAARETEALIHGVLDLGP